MSQSLDLKSCPFCGRVTGCLHSPEPELHVVQCMNCGARKPCSSTPEEAIAAWNRRAVTVEALQAKSDCTRVQLRIEEFEEQRGLGL